LAVACHLIYDAVIVKLMLRALEAKMRADIDLVSKDLFMFWKRFFGQLHGPRSALVGLARSLAYIRDGVIV
jgi:hypothetical protein